MNRPPRLLTQQDGRRYAIQQVDQIAYTVSRHRCRGDIRPQYSGLIQAALALKRNGTDQAVIGFFVVLTDLIGSRVYGLEEGDYREMEKRCAFRHWAPKQKEEA